MIVDTPCSVRPALRAEALLLAVVARGALRWLSVPQVARALKALPRCRRGRTEGVDECMAAAAFGAAKAAHPTCLFRSLVAFALLARRRHDAAIHLGANREGGLSAHAWVTIRGNAVEPAGASIHQSLWHYQVPLERSGPHSWLPPSAFARSAPTDRGSLGGGGSGGRTGPPAPRG